MNGFERRELRLCTLVFIFEKLSVPKDLTRIVGSHVPINLNGINQFPWINQAVCLLADYSGKKGIVWYNASGNGFTDDISLHGVLCCPECLRPISCPKHWIVMERDDPLNIFPDELEKPKFKKFYEGIEF